MKRVLLGLVCGIAVHEVVDLALNFWIERQRLLIHRKAVGLD